MEKIQQYLEHTLLSPTAGYGDYDRLVAEARQYAFLGVCVPPYWVKKVKRDLRDTAIQVVTVIGFPLGYQRTETKLDEVKYALRDGADELDVVLNLSAVKSGAWDWVKIELVRLAESIHQAEKIFKLILETAYLNDDELQRLCEMCGAYGVDYAKTSTGFAPKGAEIECVRKMRSWLPAHVGIKASGGICTFTQAKAFIEAGAERIGTSSGVAIVEESLKQTNT
ncbi:deoxyribose-phosphate aldolase [Thermonema rossianum]|uniref:deoxyribose-phosphate aldolase n=1 Tax=Thermonema rossianum TaxID=55505 RepID=UPI000571BE05|nr:deoxyribose-phosphate aldolase [Thermonema rossianum]